MLQRHSNPFDRDLTSEPLLDFVIHSNSLADEILVTNSPAQRLISLNRLNEINMLALPVQNANINDILHSNSLVTSEYCGTGSEVSLKTSNNIEYGGLCWPKQDPWKPIVERSLVAVVDMAVCGRRDYLIIGAGDPALVNKQTQPSIVTAEMALEIIRILFVNLGLFYVAPCRKTSESHYYLYRFKKLFRNYQFAWSIAAYAKGDGLSENICDHLDSLGRRLEFICRAYDKICYFALKTATKDTQDNALYHLAFYVMVVTSVFDSLAHIVTEFYELTIRGLMEISLRIPKKRVTTPFYTKLNSKNQRLYDFLTREDIQHKINAFYPIRDSLQHRELLKGAAYSCNSAESRNIFGLSTEAACNLKRVPGASDCVIHLHKPYMDPILFVTWAQQELVNLVNTVIAMIDWDSRLAILSEAKRDKINAANNRFSQGIGKFVGLGQEPLYF